MNIIEPRAKQHIDQSLLRLFSILSFQGKEPTLVGSASLASNRYISDYDLLLIITTDLTATQAYQEFKSILEELYNRARVYPIEFKLETKTGTKVRWFPGTQFDFTTFEKYWPQVDFCKLDLVAQTEDNYFVEVSCIYLFGKKTRTKYEYQQSLEADRKQFEEEGSYWKALKRVFSINRLLDRKRDLVILTRIFNSPLGETYEKISHLQALDRLRKSYPKDKLLKKKIEVGLRDLKVAGGLKTIPKRIQELYDTLNREVQPIYQQFLEGSLI